MEHLDFFDRIEMLRDSLLDDLESMPTWPYDGATSDEALKVRIMMEDVRLRRIGAIASLQAILNGSLPQYAREDVR